MKTRNSFAASNRPKTGEFLLRECSFAHRKWLCLWRECARESRNASPHSILVTKTTRTTRTPDDRTLFNNVCSSGDGAYSQRKHHLRMPSHMNFNRLLWRHSTTTNLRMCRSWSWHSASQRKKVFVCLLSSIQIHSYILYIMAHYVYVSTPEICFIADNNALAVAQRRFNFFCQFFHQKLSQLPKDIVSNDILPNIQIGINDKRKTISHFAVIIFVLVEMLRCAAVMYAEQWAIHFRLIDKHKHFVVFQVFSEWKTMTRKCKHKQMQNNRKWERKEDEKSGQCWWCLCIDDATLFDNQKLRTCEHILWSCNMCICICVRAVHCVRCLFALRSNWNECFKIGWNLHID